MSKKRSKSGSIKPESQEPASSVEFSELKNSSIPAPMSVRSDPALKAIQDSVSEMATAIISNISSVIPSLPMVNVEVLDEPCPPSESRYMTVIPSSRKFEPQVRVIGPAIPIASPTGFSSTETERNIQEDEVQLEVSEISVEDFNIDELAIDEMVDSAFSNPTKLLETTPDASIPPTEIDGTLLIMNEASDPIPSPIINENLLMIDSPDLRNLQGDFEFKKSIMQPSMQPEAKHDLETKNRGEFDFLNLNNPDEGLNLSPSSIPSDLKNSLSTEENLVKPPSTIDYPAITFTMPPQSSALTVVPPALARTVVPPRIPSELERERDLSQVGDFRRAARLLLEFFNSSDAETYFEAQKKYNETKDPADKPDLETMVDDFYKRQEGLKKD